MTAPPVPLARLLAMAYRDLVDRLHVRLAEEGWPEVRPAHGFVLLGLRDAGMTGGEVAALLGVTKQAASKLLEGMAAAGLVAPGEGGGDARRRPVVITDRGRRLLATVEGIHAEAEREWAAVVGDARVAALRADLERVLRAGHGGALPPIRPTF